MVDVVIIGAGPSGSMAALKLARQGLRTVVIEKNQLPRDKSCSGVLIKKSKELVEENFGPIPQEVSCSPVHTRGIIIENAKGKVFNFEDEGLNIWREKFDHWLINQACAYGAELLDSTTVVDIIEHDDTVSLKIRKNGQYDVVNGRVAIACDGVNGIARKRFAQEHAKYIVTYQAFYHGDGTFDPHSFYAFLSPELSEYDAWLNVKDGMIAIGVGVNKAGDAKRYHDRFVDHLKRRFNMNLHRKIKEEYWRLPVIIPDFESLFGKGRLFFAGEAAGLINPMGEGISIALTSGMAVAKAITEACAAKRIFDENDILNRYQTEMKFEIEHMKRQWIFLKQLDPDFWEKLSGEQMESGNNK